MVTVEPLFCPLCAARLTERAVAGTRRRACPACEFVNYPDPKVAVGVLVEDDRGWLLYTQRNHDPQRGAWALPSGFVDRGEDVRAAAIREVREEAGLEVALDALLGVFSHSGDPVVFIVFRAHPVGGTLQPGPEAQALRYFPPDALPPPAFPSDREVREAWRAARAAPPAPLD